MKRILKAILPLAWVRWGGNFLSSSGGRYLRESYSQEGEDLILERFFENRNSGFYVDVGAHHPRRFSNTFLFYKRGWRGINIEPNPDALKLFQRQRKKDINLGYGVADTEGPLSYFMFNEPALNSFDRRLSEKRQDSRYHIIDTKTIAVRKLSAIFEEFLPHGTFIDFMSIDVEGYDLQVLQSNDWTRFRPACVLVESSGFDLQKPAAEPIHMFLEQQNYYLFAKTFNTLFYLNRANIKASDAKAQSR
jgi:FkbM family methyltransferase